MKVITKKQVVIFLSAAIIPAGYFFARYIFYWCGIPWQTRYNIPGFLLLTGSLPWSWPSLYYPIQLISLFGHVGFNLFTIVTVCGGLALNITIVITLVGKFIRITSGWRRA